MRRVIVGTSFDEGYLPKMQQYSFLESLEWLNADYKFALVLDCRPELISDLGVKFKTIEFISVPKRSIRLPQQMALLACPQYGAFVEHVPSLRDDDYVFFIDGDITCQRQFHDFELARLRKDAKLLVSPNGRGDHSFHDELLVLDGAVRMWQHEITYGDLRKLKVFNCGVIGQTVSEWKRTLSLFEKYFPTWSLKHHASVQLHLCWLFQTQKFEMFDPWSRFPQRIHANCHEEDSIRFFGLSRRTDGIIVGPDGVPPLFAHAHLHPRWQHLLQPKGTP